MATYKEVELEIEWDDIVDFLNSSSKKDVRNIIEETAHEDLLTDEITNESVYDVYFYEHFGRVKEEYTLEQFQRMMPVKP